MPLKSTTSLTSPSIGGRCPPSHADRSAEPLAVPCQDRGRAADHALPAAARGRRHLGFQVGVAGVLGDGGGQGGAERSRGVAGVCRGVADVALQRDREPPLLLFPAPGKLLSSASWEADM